MNNKAWPVIALKTDSLTNASMLNNRELEYQKDVWQLKVVGIKPPPYVSATYLTFIYINPEWLRCLAKKFIRFQSATRAYYTLQQYIQSITRFSGFLQSYPKKLRPEDINRNIILDFIDYVHHLSQVNDVKNKMISHLKLVIAVAGNEGWANFTQIGRAHV